MKRQNKLAMIYQMHSSVRHDNKRSKQAKSSEGDFKAKLGEMKKHLAAFGSKYSRE